MRKGKAVFVEPDLPQLKRWLFIPPHARNGVKEGDYVRCAILRHPIRDGKPQAKVLAVIGDDDTPGIENLYSMAKYRLASEWSSASKQEVEQLLGQCKPLETEQAPRPHRPRIRHHRRRQDPGHRRCPVR